MPIREPSEPPEAGRVVFSSAIDCFFFFLCFLSLPLSFAAPLSLSFALSNTSSRAELRRVWT